MSFVEFVKQHRQMFEEEITERIKATDSDPDSYVFGIQRNSFDDLIDVLRDYHRVFITPLLKRDEPAR